MLYKIEFDGENEAIKFVDAIEVNPSPYISLTQGHVDISEHNFVIMSNAHCYAQEGDTILSLSAYFYNFASKQWSCMDLDMSYSHTYAWDIVQ